MKINSTFIRSILFLAVAALLISAGLVAFAQNGDSASLATEPKELATGDTPPDFTADSLAGVEYTLSELDKPVVIDFWATWCPPCRASIPSLVEFYESYKDQVYVLGISLDDEDKEEEVLGFMEANNMAYPVIHDYARAISTPYAIRGIPTMILINTDGTIANVHVGYDDTMDLSTMFAEELGLEAVEEATAEE